MTRQRNEDWGSYSLISLLSCLPRNFRTMSWGRTRGGRASFLSSVCAAPQMGFLPLGILRHLTTVTIFPAWWA